MADDDEPKSDDPSAEAPPEEQEQKSSGEAEASDEISLDDLDSLLAEEDPEFQSEMTSMEADDSLKNVDVVEDEAPDPEVEKEAEEAKKVSKLASLQRLIERALTPIFFLIDKFLVLKERTVSFVKNFKGILFGFLKEDLPKHAARVKAKVTMVIDYIKFAKAWVKSQSLASKLGLIGIVLLIVLAYFLVRFNMQGRWIPYLSEPLLTSLELEKDPAKRVEKVSDYVLLEKAFPEPTFVVLLDRVIVNLRPTRGHANPMGNFEFYAAADSRDTAIEIRDRNKELSDLTQRVVEGFSFPEVMSERGKRKIKSEVRSAINQVLNRGRVREIYVKGYSARP